MHTALGKCGSESIRNGRHIYICEGSGEIFGCHGIIAGEAVSVGQGYAEAVEAALEPEITDDFSRRVLFRIDGEVTRNHLRAKVIGLVIDIRDNFGEWRRFPDTEAVISSIFEKMGGADGFITDWDSGFSKFLVEEPCRGISRVRDADTYFAVLFLKGHGAD